MQWLEAMNREKQCHVKNGTFGENGKDPDPPKSIPAGWVFKIKHRGAPIEAKDLTAKQFKARVVIRGQFMKEGLEYNDTFAPAALPLCAQYLPSPPNTVANSSLEMWKPHFWPQDMDCEVWVKMPAMWGHGENEITGVDETLQPRKLLKGVPGIPQGSRLYYETFQTKLQEMGWVPAKADKCLFVNPSLKERTAVLIWVDDFIFMHEQETTWFNFIEQLRTRFTIPLVGPWNGY